MVYAENRRAENIAHLKRVLNGRRYFRTKSKHPDHFEFTMSWFAYEMATGTYPTADEYTEIAREELAKLEGETNVLRIRGRQSARPRRRGTAHAGKRGTDRPPV